MKFGGLLSLLWAVICGEFRTDYMNSARLALQAGFAKKKIVLTKG
jgi:hypothetical protein